MFAAPLASLARIARSPGSINDPQGTGADFWRLGTALEAAGFRPGELGLNSFSYHLTPGGLMLDGGLRARRDDLGPLVDARGAGGTGQQPTRVRTCASGRGRSKESRGAFLGNRTDAGGVPAALA